MPLVPLSPSQVEARRRVLSHLSDGAYRTLAVPCVVCGRDTFEQLAEKDRYGLPYEVGICLACGFVQATQQLTQQSLEHFYRDDYRLLYVGNEEASEDFFAGQRARGQRIFAWLQRHRLLEPGGRVLEVGCGAGGILAEFSERGFEVEGIDLGARYLTFGRSHGLRLTQGSIASLSLEPADLIIYSHVFEHLGDPRAELKRLQYLLRPGGRLFIEVPGVKNLGTNFRYDVLRYLQNAHTLHFSLRTLTRLAATEGWSLIAGDETIRAAFSPGPINGFDISNDYDDVTRYLRRARLVRPFVRTAERIITRLGIRDTVAAVVKSVRGPDPLT